MIPKTLMKNPMLMIGILLMVIFLGGLGDKSIFSRKEKLTPTSCKAVLIMLNKRIPATWTTDCEQNNLKIHILANVELKSEEEQKRDQELRAVLFRELANNLVFVAKNSPIDSLERTDAITMSIQAGNRKINAASFGRHVIKLNTMKSQKFIKEHLQATVKVQEVKL